MRSTVFGTATSTMMSRTRTRSLPAGRLSATQALVFGLTLGLASVVIFAVLVNLLSAVLALSAILFYVVVYTMWLKRTTPQNIVIGGAAGAVPVLIGWAAATNTVGLPALWMFISFSGHRRTSGLSLVLKKDYARGCANAPRRQGEGETYSRSSSPVVLVLATLGLFATHPWAISTSRRPRGPRAAGFARRRGRPSGAHHVLDVEHLQRSCSRPWCSTKCCANQERRTRRLRCLRGRGGVLFPGLRWIPPRRMVRRFRRRMVLPQRGAARCSPGALPALSALLWFVGRRVVIASHARCAMAVVEPARHWRARAHCNRCAIGRRPVRILLTGGTLKHMPHKEISVLGRAPAPEKEASYAVRGV
jgi:hypothetical protein